MKPFVKYQVIQRHSGQYSVSVMCQFFGVSRSGYYDFLRRKDHPDKDAPIAEIITQQQEKCFHTYGYRRIASSMSRRGNCYDNALAENFFGILKTEYIYRHKPETFKGINEMIDRYIHFYNYERIPLKTGVAPLTLRHST